MKWTDIQDIAIALAEIHPDTDPKTVRFTDLYRWPAAAGFKYFSAEALTRLRIEHAAPFFLRRFFKGGIRIRAQDFGPFIAVIARRVATSENMAECIWPA